MKKIGIVGGVLFLVIVIVIGSGRMHSSSDSLVETDVTGLSNQINATNSIEGVPATLAGKNWLWVRTDYTDGRVFAPKKEEAFTLMFSGERNVSATTDCNSMAGTYTVVADSLIFEQMAMTKMYCEGSEEGVFSESLGQVATYRFTPKGELELGLKVDTGTMIFR